MTARKTTPRKATSAGKATKKATKKAGSKAARKSTKKAAKKSVPKKASRSAARSASTKRTFARGDKVTWTTPQGDTQGVIERKVTRPMKIKEHEVAASPENPEYIVQSEKSGKIAAHKPESLSKQGS